MWRQLLGLLLHLSILIRGGNKIADVACGTGYCLSETLDSWDSDITAYGFLNGQKRIPRHPVLASTFHLHNFLTRIGCRGQ